MCADFPMCAGTHYVEVTLVERGEGSPYVGVVEPHNFDPTRRIGYESSDDEHDSDDETIEQTLQKTVWRSESARMIFVGRGTVAHDGEHSEGGPMADQWGDELEEDDTVGLLLDFRTSTLAVYKNGERKGVAVHWTEPLSQLCWAVDLYGDKVRIEAVAAPVVSAERLAADLRALRSEEAA